MAKPIPSIPSSLTDADVEALRRAARNYLKSGGALLCDDLLSFDESRDAILEALVDRLSPDVEADFSEAIDHACSQRDRDDVNNAARQLVIVWANAGFVFGTLVRAELDRLFGGTPAAKVYGFRPAIVHRPAPVNTIDAQ